MAQRATYIHMDENPSLIMNEESKKNTEKFRKIQTVYTLYKI